MFAVSHCMNGCKPLGGAAGVVQHLRISSGAAGGRTALQLTFVFAVYPRVCHTLCACPRPQLSSSHCQGIAASAQPSLLSPKCLSAGSPCSANKLQPSAQSYARHLKRCWLQCIPARSSQASVHLGKHVMHVHEADLHDRHVHWRGQSSTHHAPPNSSASAGQKHHQAVSAG